MFRRLFIASIISLGMAATATALFARQPLPPATNFCHAGAVNCDPDNTEHNVHCGARDVCIPS